VGELLQILAACIIFRALASFMDSFLAAYDLVKILTIKQILSLFILLISVGYAINYDVTGVAIAVVIASALRFLLTLFFIVIKTEVTSVQLLKAFAPSILSPALILIGYFAISQSPMFSGLVGIIISVTLFLVISIIMPFKILLSSNVVDFIKELKVKYAFVLNERYKKGCNA